MRYSIYELATYIFDPIHSFWESEKTQRIVTNLLIVTFIGAIIGIELSNRGLLPSFLAQKTPESHYHAIGIAFTLVLVLEVISLIFVLPCSFAKSVGKQFEILCLILMRNSFKELVNFPEPISITGDMTPVYQILSDGVGAFLVFVLLGVYYKVQKSTGQRTLKPQAKFHYIASKKLIALILLFLFIGIGFYNISSPLRGAKPFDFFSTFYTILIFSDILLVLISQRFLPSFHAVFRNSSFALITLLIRLALASPPFYNAALGVIAVGLSVLLTLAYNAFYTTKK